MKKRVHFREEPEQEDIFLYDWVSFSTQLSLSQVIELLGMQHIDFQSFPGRYGYKTRYSFGGIHILMDGFDDSMGICVEMSGQGCRDWETFSSCPDYFLLWWAAYYDEIQLTRVDVAFDDHTGRIPMDEVVHLTVNHLHRSLWKSYKVELSNEGTSCNYGSRQSECYCRIYDKAAERGIEGTHWVRCETVFKRERAEELTKLIIDHGGMSEQLYFGILQHYLDFCIPGEDTNKSRWPLCSWWDDLVNGSDEITLIKKPGEVYNLSEKEYQLFKQYGNSMLLIILCRGFDYFVSKIISGDNWLRKKYIDICRREKLPVQEITMERVLQLKSKLGWIETEIMRNAYDLEGEYVD